MPIRLPQGPLESVCSLLHMLGAQAPTNETLNHLINMLSSPWSPLQHKTHIWVESTQGPTQGPTANNPTQPKRRPMLRRAGV